MPKFGYSREIPEPCAKAYGRELRISPKDAVEICRAIRGMKLSQKISGRGKEKEKTCSISYT
ncbi:MAG: hypothetical protein QXP51_05575 [Candidatus Hadarchaeales archaeon]